MGQAFNQFVDKVKNNQVGDYTFIDADTIRGPDGKGYRLQGYDAPEVSGFKGGYWKPGTAGSYEGTQAIINLATSGGFNNVVKTGKTDPNGREIIRLHNPEGEDFTEKLISSGVLRPGQYTTQEDIVSAEVAQLFRDDNFDDTEWGRAAKTVADAVKRDSDEDLQFKEQAINELLYSQRPDKYTSAVQFRSPDRDLDNNSLNPFSDSWSQGWVSARESAYGFASLLGDVTDSEWLSNVGEAGVARAQADFGEKGRLLLDYQDVNGFGDAIEYVSNNFAISLPYLLGIAGSAAGAAVAGPALGLGTVGTFALGATAPASIYAGQTWNEMEGEKNPFIALGSGVAQATLDRLGLSALIRTGKGSKQLLRDAVNELVKQGNTREVAERTVANATRRELGGFLGDAAKIASEQLRSKEVAKKALRNLIVAGGSEAATEALQEATGYYAAVIGSDKTPDASELANRVINGAIAGGTIGGAISIPGSIVDTAAWADVAGKLSIVSPEDNTFFQEAIRKEEENHGYVRTTGEVLDTIAEDVTDVESDINLLAEGEVERRKNQSLVDEGVERLSNIQALWQNSVRNVLPPALQEKYEAARYLAEFFGGNVADQRTLSGPTFENFKHHVVTKFRNMVGQPENVYAILNKGKRVTNDDRIRISQRVYSTLQNAIDKKTNRFNIDLVSDTDPDKVLLSEIARDLNRLGDELWRQQKEFNPDLGYVDNYLFKYKSINPSAVTNNKKGFINALQKEYGLSRGEALQITDAILNSNEVNDIDEAFSVVKGSGKPSSHKSRSFGLSEKESFQEFVEQDLFANISNASRSAARYIAHQKYIGDNNKVINRLLDQMKKQGASDREIGKVAAGIKDFIDAESGNYKRPTTDSGKKLLEIQKNFLFYTALAGLPLATISSTVEVMLVNAGLRYDQIFGKGKDGSIQAIAKEGGKTISAALDDVTKALTDRALTKDLSNPNKVIARDLGYYSWDVGAATTTGVTEVRKDRQKALEIFFKVTGLQGWTNYTRVARGAIAGDYILDKLDVVSNYNNSKGPNNPKTKEIQEAEESLLNIGIDPKRMSDIKRKMDADLPLTEQEQKLYEDFMRDGMFNFVNNAIALPQTANRPLFYQDPRLALFTQFNGFIATFTAHHIPKMWNEYVKRGTPAMKYNTFAVATTMIALGFISQELKDRIKFFGENPYLEPHEKWRRAVYASGLLGSGERVIDFFFPLYGEERTSGALDWTFTTVRGESPALSNISRLINATGRVLGGEPQEGIRQGLKVVPGLGPFNEINTAVSHLLTGNWQYITGGNNG